MHNNLASGLPAADWFAMNALGMPEILVMLLMALKFLLLLF